ncbi:hypothetical protein GpartN1_g4981.t1 [Galdieria partita]|uniref:Uncharacterized protein n=1 Tax=Galdieria partita TaxID=83374 RepID=A0A9C7PZC0_9RHOD|nr:hypothetical protein GpartN1_g4981.t1 [Galdieria partita]
MSNWSPNTPDYQRLPQKRKRTSECLLDHSKELENKRFHIGNDSLEVHKDYANIQHNMKETFSNQSWVLDDDTAVLSRDPFPVLRMLLSNEEKKDNYTFTVTDAQLASFNPLKELYFSTNNQFVCDEQQRTTNSHLLNSTEWYTCQDNPTYEIVPYTPEKDIKRWLQSYSDDNDYSKTSHSFHELAKDAMELE